MRRQSAREKRNKKSWSRHRPPRTAQEFFAKSVRFQDTWILVTHAISKMRADGVSRRRAAREFQIDPRTVARWGRSALRKRPSGRYEAKPSDRLLRVLFYPTHEGLREIAVRDSRQASRLAEYSAAVDKYLETGDASGIEKFRGKQITDASRKRIPLLTSLEELDRLGSAGVLSFESLYARSS